MQSDSGRCPRCREATLDDRLVKACTRCHGTWIPEAVLHGRIEAVRRAGAPRLELDWGREDREALACATCGAAMETLHLFHVPVDRCRAHGVWFDPGELADVLRHCAEHSRRRDRNTGSGDGDGAGWFAAEVATEAAFVAPELAMAGVVTTVAVAESAGAAAEVAEAAGGAAAVVTEASGGALEFVVDGVGVVAGTIVDVIGGIFGAILD